LIPMEFHRFLLKNRGRLREEGLILILVKPLLAGFPWEYVPVAVAKDDILQAQHIKDTWQALPMLRSIPDTRPGGRNENNNAPARRSFFSFGLSPQPVNFLGRNAWYRPNDNARPQDAKNDLSLRFYEDDFLHLACHAHPGRFTMSGNPDSGFLFAEEVKAQPVLPRVMDADCCHTAEAGDETEDWDKTLPGSFIRQNGGCAVFCGNLGAARYIGNTEIKTIFSEYFVKYFNEYGPDNRLGEDRKFIEIALKTREQQSDLNDQNNSQVIYVAYNWDAENYRRDRLLKDIVISKEMPYPGQEPIKRLTLPSKILMLLSLEILAAQWIPPLRSWLKFENRAGNTVLAVCGFMAAVIIWQVSRLISVWRSSGKKQPRPNN